MAALVAAAFLVGLALHGERPEPGLARFEAAGLMTRFSPGEAQEVEIVTTDGTWRFRRDTTWSEIAAARPVPAGFAGRIEAALRLLRDSGPSRVMSPAEVAGMAPGEYGLDRGAMRVTVWSSTGATFVIRFGRRNPLGLGRYARIEGVDGVPILPAFVADAWEQVVGGPPG
jgi:hypothetical protein